MSAHLDSRDSLLKAEVDDLVKAIEAVVLQNIFAPSILESALRGKYEICSEEIIVPALEKLLKKYRKE